MHRRSSNAASLAILAIGLGCSREDRARPPEMAEAIKSSLPVGRTVQILAPAEGDEVGPDVRVELGTTGIDIAPIADGRMDTGHHHLFLDTDLTSLDEMIPAGVPLIVHKGDGSAEHTFEGLAPGPHRLIVVVADPAHVPIDPPVADTVRFTVSG